MKKDYSGDLIRGSQFNTVDRWALPSFDEETTEDQVVSAQDGSEEGVLQPTAEEVQPLSLEELEAIRQDAYNEGFSAGEKDGFQSGQVKAQQESKAAEQKRVEQFRTLLTNLFDPIADQDRQIEQMLGELLEKAVRQVVMRELQLDSSQIRQVLMEALKCLPMGANNLRLFVSPQDFDQIKTYRDRLEENWRILEDDTLQPGGCRVEAEHTRIDATTETRLQQVLERIASARQESGAPAQADLQVNLDAP